MDEAQQKNFEALANAVSVMAGGNSIATRPDEVKLIYSQKQEWARHFNGLIWSISSVLLPVALGGLALPFRGDDGQLQTYPLLFTAIASVGLLFIWSAICDGQRKLWEREYKVIHLIEAAWQLRPAPTSISDAGGHVLQFKSGHVARLRGAIVTFVALLWLFRIVFELIAE